MKFVKNYTFSDQYQIWRLLISGSDKLIIELRDTDKKEMFFSCIDIHTGEPVFSKKQLDEPYWIGIEQIHNDVIFFHKFAKPDMPGHREIIAFDIITQEILWTSDQYTFLFIFNDKLYVSTESFEGNKYYTLDYKNGKVIEKLIADSVEIAKLKNIADQSLNYDNYIFPKTFESGNSGVSENVNILINKEANNLDIIGNIEYTEFRGLLLFNMHIKVLDNSLVNKFFVKNLENGEEIFTEILNANVNAFAPDSFFCYKNYVLMLKEKKELLVYKIE